MVDYQESYEVEHQTPDRVQRSPMQGSATAAQILEQYLYSTEDSLPQFIFLSNSSISFLIQSKPLVDKVQFFVYGDPKWIVRKDFNGILSHKASQSHN
ncbi:hypothetical protein K9N68_08930 [Kovacikia minuta CCNUW1]|uniref:hypothetical protein n=1 Tax=Kovacikia minuta TaxID=2931930 RepID=UPI001CC99322|nr:hypothetical protein [Kovacikia minuta]UBF28000.1 hypothetical protein K9N68_08930 [Kovacikia minuta CCNUW1]